LLALLIINRAPNHYRKPAESNEPVEKHMRLTQEQVHVVANEFHASRIARNPRASPFTSARRIEITLGIRGMRGLLTLLFGQTPSPENHAKLLFTTEIPSGLRSAYYIKI
jgi:hypothetical protein